MNLTDNARAVHSVLDEAEADALEALGLLLSAERASWPASIRVYSTAAEVLGTIAADPSTPRDRGERSSYTIGYLLSHYEQIHREYCELATRLARAEAARDGLRDIIANSDVIPY